MSQAQETAQAKPRKPRKPKPSTVERRLMEGAELMKSVTQDGVFWTYTDTGRTARADLCRKLLEAGKLAPRADGLFGDDSQTWGLA